MNGTKMLLVLIGLMMATGFVFAATDCAASAYRKACANCQFDANGKIDQSCSGGYKAGGTSCMTSSYPIMSTKYADGKCPQVDSCVAELQSCVAQYSTGNDKADCQEGSVAVCYSAADVCVKQAAIKCGEIEKDCPGSTASFILIGLGAVFLGVKL